MNILRLLFYMAAVYLVVRFIRGFLSGDSAGNDRHDREKVRPDVIDVCSKCGEALVGQSPSRHQCST